MSDHDVVPLYSVRRLPLGVGSAADFIFAERASTLAEAHGAAAEWRSITNEAGLSFYCRVEIVIPSTKKRDGFYRIWIGPQERGMALKHLPGENVERRTDVMRAHLDKPRTKHKRRRKLRKAS